MGGGGDTSSCPFRQRIEQWKIIGGGIDQDGNILKEPWQVTQAKMIDTLCQRYGCLPSQLMQESMDMIFPMHALLTMIGNEDSMEQESSPDPVLSRLANMSQRL